MRNALYIKLLALVVLTGCSAGYTSRSSDVAYLIGPNGLEFASASQNLADIEGRTFSVTVARFVRDTDSGEGSIQVSEETVTLASGFTTGDTIDLTLSLDGEELTFVNGRASMESGQSVWGYLNFTLDRPTIYSATGGFYSYEKYLDPSESDVFETEGYFAVGFQTDPSEILEMSGPIEYRGEYHGFGQLLDTEGGLLNDELQTNGLISITVDFDSSSASGVLNGLFDPDGSADAYTMFFVDAALDGNSFAAAPDMVCAPGATCTSATNLGGSFFGPAGDEISGVIGFDETTEIAETTSRFIGAAGFSTTRHPEPPEVSEVSSTD
ncbi:MAG: hypothetical protein HKP54_10980 [Boseongicola sp.]|nr:hypothetical protein [Boseongicola sp.]